MIIALAMILPCMTSAQDYQTFIDVHAGRSFSSSDIMSVGGDYDIYGLNADLTFGLNITEGCQILPNLFAGIGFGGYAALFGYKPDDYSYYHREFKFLTFPFYANVRWTLNREARITPFADLKIGYQLGVKLNNGCLSDYSSGDYIFVNPRNTIYFVPSIGVRFGKAAGFNLGIAYNPSMGMEFKQRMDENGHNVYKTLDKTSKGIFMITLGADF